jgi:hypothetical protein
MTARPTCLFAMAVLVLLAWPSTAVSLGAAPAACLDADGDGWTDCDGDCCDGPGPCGAVPAAEVNPGAFEVAGNAVDDDCHAGTTDGGAGPCDVSLPSNSSDPLDYARAIDLCSFTVESPPLAEKKWGVIGAAFALAGGSGTPAVNSRSIRPSFGTAVTPLAGTKLAVLSSGQAAAPGQTNPAWINAQDPGADMTTTSPLPPDWLAVHGGLPPVTRGCPAPQDGTTAYDSMLLRVRVRVPTNARSFSVKAFVYGSEYPEYVCSPYVDYFLALLDSRVAPRRARKANPVDKNLAVFGWMPARRDRAHLVGGNLAVLDRGLFTACQNGPTGCATGDGAVPGAITSCAGTAQLQGTGFDLANPAPKFPGDPGSCSANDLLGGGTGWLTIRGNVQRGETIELRFVVWDTGDPWYDSVVLLDDFRWSVDPTTPGADGPAPPGPCVPPANPCDGRACGSVTFCGVTTMCPNTCNPDETCAGNQCVCGQAEVCQEAAVQCGPATSERCRETVECGACREAEVCLEGACRAYEGADPCTSCLEQGASTCCCLAGQSTYCTRSDACPEGYQQCATCQEEPDPCTSRPSECGPGIDLCMQPFDCGPCAAGGQMCVQTTARSNSCADVGGDPCQACCQSNGVCCTLPDGSAPYCLGPGATGCPVPYVPRCLP